jgi:hypothetical protein
MAIQEKKAARKKIWKNEIPVKTNRVQNGRDGKGGQVAALSVKRDTNEHGEYVWTVMSDLMDAWVLLKNRKAVFLFARKEEPAFLKRKRVYVPIHLVGKLWRTNPASEIKHAVNALETQFVLKMAQSVNAFQVFRETDSTVKTLTSVTRERTFASLQRNASTQKAAFSAPAREDSDYTKRGMKVVLTSTSVLKIWLIALNRNSGNWQGEI